MNKKILDNLSVEKIETHLIGMKKQLLNYKNKTYTTCFLCTGTGCPDCSWIIFTGDSCLHYRKRNDGNYYYYMTKNDKHQRLSGRIRQLSSWIRQLEQYLKERKK